MSYILIRHVNCAEHYGTRRRLSVRTLMLLAVTLALTAPAWALDPKRNVSQYGHSTWRLQDGIFPGVPQVIAQTADGYLWIGTTSGLVRFDGVRFVPWVFPPGEALPSPSIFALHGARDGSLWIGTAGGVSRWKQGHLVTYRDHRGRVQAIRESPDGTIGFVRTRPNDDSGGFCQVAGEVTKCFGPAEGSPVRLAQTLVEDGQGGFWVGSSAGLTHWTAGKPANHFPDRLKDASGQTGLISFALMRDGTVLVGLGQAGPGFGLQTLVDGIWRDYRLPEIKDPSFAVGALIIDRDQGIWISTVDTGIFHVHQGHTDHFRQADGLTSDSITSFYEDREGNIWTASPDGIDRFRDLAVGTVSTREGLPPNIVGSVSPSRDGNVWIGGGLSLNLIKDGRRFPLEIPGGMPVRRLTSLIEDHTGRLWMGTEAGVSVLAAGRFRSITKARDGSTLAMVTALAEDTEGNIWALTIDRPHRLLCIRGFETLHEYALASKAAGGALAADPTGGVWIGLGNGDLVRYRSGHPMVVEKADGPDGIRNVVVDPDGSTWAVLPGALVRRQAGQMRRLDQRNGLPCTNLISAIRDASNALWVYAGCGLMRIEAQSLDRWWQDPESRVVVKLFDGLDGAHAESAPFGPIATRSSDGRLWFTNDTAIQFVDPRHLTRNDLPPPVYVEQIVADRMSHLPAQNLRLPALTRDLQIDYTALSMTVPQKVRFRYRLEGRDSGWEEAGTRRQAFYTDLPPNKYRFRVIACNNDGVWNEEGASLAFSITPAYYQTAWFYLFGGIAAGLALWMIYQIRVRQIGAAISLRFDERMAERNRLSGELHDTILQSVQISKMLADHALNDASNNSLESMRNAMVTLSGWLAQANTDGRSALNALRESTAPKHDLAEAFRQAAEVSAVTGAVEFVVSVEGTVREMHPIVQDEVYRIGCEAIRNACVHADATQINVKLIFAQDLTVRVQDNGKGIEPGMVTAGKPGHFGLAGMQERAIRIGGRFHLMSRPGAGTEIELSVPAKIAFPREPRAKGLPKLRGLANSSPSGPALPGEIGQRYE